MKLIDRKKAELNENLLEFKKWLETGDLNAGWPVVGDGPDTAEYQRPKLPPSKADELFTGEKVKKKKPKKTVYVKPTLPDSFEPVSIGST